VLLDVIVDLRPDSPTRSSSGDAVELTADNRRILYIPAGIAHGFTSPSPTTRGVFCYHASSPWAPGAERGVPGTIRVRHQWLRPVADFQEKD
jgi:dTDP-4-dehydrorhamnose 3,5-epimerase